MTPRSPDPEAFRRRVRQLIDRLGFTDDEDYVVEPEGLPTSQTSHSLRSAFETMGVVGAFCPKSTLGIGSDRAIPVLYLAVTDDEGRDAVHRKVWSQSVVPYLLLATPSGFEVRNGFDYRGTRDAVAWTALDEGALPPSLTSLSAGALRSASAWRGFHMPTRVDERLGRAVRELSRRVVADGSALSGRPAVVNAVIGRFLYLYVLIDRGVVDQRWVDTLRVDGRPACASVTLREGFGPDEPRPGVWAAEDVWRLFDAIDAVLNGSPFPVRRRDRALLDGATLHVVRSALRRDELVDGKVQYGFLDVDYATIRTETIAALYENFFELEEGPRKRQDGAFYTPPFLVDYVVDEVDARKPFGSGSLIVDPACGSGAFLVAGFRRMIERMRADGRALDARALHDTLANCILGFEIKRQAVNVARFSLYLTMLDYVAGLSLADVPRVMEGRPLFPDLRRRVMLRDAFRRLPRRARRRATHVLANPPWTQVRSATPAAAYRDRAASRPGRVPLMALGDGIAEAFYWRAVNDVCARDGVVAMVLPTKSFIAPSKGPFPSALASESRIIGITNLAHFRERLFATARAAATVVFATPEAPRPLDWTWLYSPKVSSQPVGSNGHPWAIVVDPGQVETVRQADFLLPGHEWFRTLMLQPLDRLLARSLSEGRGASGGDVAPALADLDGSSRPSIAGRVSGTPTLGDFMDALGIEVRRGGTPEETGLPARLLLNTKSNDYRARLGLGSNRSRDYRLGDDDLARVRPGYTRAFRGPVLLMPRSQAPSHLADHPVGFASTLLGVHFASEDAPRAERTAILREIAAYARTSVGRYLLALFGRTWVFDQRRFEGRDLRRLPFPYGGIDDLMTTPVSGFADEDFTSFCATRFQVGALFETAVREHHDLREKYQDGRRPYEGTKETDERQRLSYKDVLIAELTRLVGDVPLLLDSMDPPSAGTVRFRLRFGVGGDAPPRRTLPEIRLAEEASLTLRETDDGAFADFVKPDMRSAWTAERAYADALLTARRVFEA